MVLLTLQGTLSLYVSSQFGLSLSIKSSHRIKENLFASLSFFARNFFLSLSSSLLSLSSLSLSLLLSPVYCKTALLLKSKKWLLTPSKYEISLCDFRTNQSEGI